MKDTWFSRDLPVLDAVVRWFEESEGLPEVCDVVPMVGFDVAMVVKALSALHPDYLEFNRGSGDREAWFVQEVQPSARRAVGQWPTPANLTDRLLAELDEADTKTDDPVRKGKIKQLVQTIGGPAKDMFVEITAKVISNQIGG
jgi:hypothetical protein